MSMPAQLNHVYKSKKPKNVLNHESKDIRGFFVCDRNHKKIGMVSEIYCDRFDFSPRYIEITPLNEKVEKIFIYPFDYIKWHANGPAFIETTEDCLDKYETYDADYILSVEGKDLVTYSEALEYAMIFYDYDRKYCA